MQEVPTTNEQKQCNNPETSNAIARGNTVHTDCHLKGYRACSLSFFIASWLLAVQTVGRASRAECSSMVKIYPCSSLRVSAANLDVCRTAEHRAARAIHMCGTRLTLSSHLPSLSLSPTPPSLSACSQIRERK